MFSLIRSKRERNYQIDLTRIRLRCNGYVEGFCKVFAFCFHNSHMQLLVYKTFWQNHRYIINCMPRVTHSLLPALSPNLWLDCVVADARTHRHFRLYNYAFLQPCLLIQCYDYFHIIRCCKRFCLLNINNTTVYVMSTAVNAFLSSWISDLVISCT